MGLGRLSSSHFSSFKLHASSQSLQIAPCAQKKASDEPGVTFHSLQALDMWFWGPCHGAGQWRQDCAQKANASLCTISTSHHSLEGRPAASQDTSFSHMPGFIPPNPLLSWGLESLGDSLTAWFYPNWQLPAPGNTPFCLASKSWMPTHSFFFILKCPRSVCSFDNVSDHPSKL